MSSAQMQRELTNFVEWIATDPNVEDSIRDQMKTIRERICSQAASDSLVVRSTPNAGSFAKRTGLRRHFLGSSDVEGQDVDLPFVVSPKTQSDEQLDSLVGRFLKYTKATFPTTKATLKKKCVELNFESNKRRFDIVPMLGTKSPERQIIIQSDGTQVETSLQGHIDFVKKRTALSQELPGRVKFNEMVRLFKWWRYFRFANGGGAFTSAEEVPSFLIELLCAAAFDATGVKATYAETLEAIS